jgi:invasion protein IalB
MRQPKARGPHSILRTTIALAAAIAGGPALAQMGEIAATHGDWQIRCFVAEEGRGGETCALHQFVTAEGRDDADLRVLVWRDDDVGPVLQVVTPLEVRLRAQVSVTVDEEVIGRMEFERCSVDGCIAEVLIDEAALERFRTGETAVFGYQLTTDADANAAIGFPILLNGFAEGFDALDNWPPAGG